MANIQKKILMRLVRFVVNIS